jgi:hypothetical protein
MTFGVGPMAKHKEYYKGEGGGFPQVWAVVSIVSMCFTQNIKLTFNFIKKKPTFNKIQVVAFNFTQTYIHLQFHL